MRVVVAVGGNALLRRHQPPSSENQLHNVAIASRGLAAVAREHELVIVHGNGPQVGLIALQAQAVASPAPYPLDMLGAESMGLIGYLLEQGVSNELRAAHSDRAVATLLTRVEVDADDPAFDRPTKPIGPLMTAAEAQTLSQRHGWVCAPDGTAGWRRVVPSPAAQALVDARPLRWLLAQGSIVICGGGGGIAVVNRSNGWKGVEAVIDKDDCAALIAQTLDADRLVIATDVDAIYLDWGSPVQRALHEVSEADLRRQRFASGSMQPKVDAACAFAARSGRPAAVGALADIEALVRGETGTRVLPT